MRSNSVLNIFCSCTLHILLLFTVPMLFTSKEAYPAAIFDCTFGSVTASFKDNKYKLQLS